jgi:hypothetical protein
MSKVFIISLHRCGTQSTGLFLQAAGLRRCHWPAVVDGIDYQSRIVGAEADSARITDILSPLFDRFDVFDDVPFPILYQDLSTKYQDARFVAVHRDPIDWVRSVRDHCGSRLLDPYERAQYWRYLAKRPLSLDEVTDSELFAMFLDHYQNISEHFANRGNLLAVDLADADIGRKIADFAGIRGGRFPDYDYKRLVAHPP